MARDIAPEIMNEFRAYPGVTTFILGLQYHIKLDEGMIGFCLGPSTRLMSHALDIGIEPIYYVTLDRRVEGEGEQVA